MTQPTRLLRIDASARSEGSTSRALTDDLLNTLRERHGRLAVTNRDLARTPPPFVDADWIAASYTDPAARSVDQRAALAISDTLVAELLAADVILLGVPVYNFGIPASLKAWIDQVARARVTFRYTENGPEGLLKGKKAYIVFTSGGVAVGSEVDYASSYLRHVLGFLGIEAVEIIAADQQMLRSDALTQAQQRIRDLQRSAA